MFIYLRKTIICILIILILNENLFFVVFAEPKIENNNSKNIEKNIKKEEPNKNPLTIQKLPVKSHSLTQDEIIKSKITDFKEGDIIIEIQKGTIIKPRDSKNQIIPSQISISETNKSNKEEITKTILSRRLDDKNGFVSKIKEKLKNVSFENLEKALISTNKSVLNLQKSINKSDKSKKDNLVILKRVLEEKLFSKTVKIFNFGFLDNDLIFGKPVKVIIPVSSKDGLTLEVLAKENGKKDFSNYGFSLDPNTNCKKGISSNNEKDFFVPVNKGKIVFYTCSASNFIVVEKAKKDNIKVNQDSKKILTYKKYLTETKSLVSSFNVSSGATLVSTGSNFKNGDIVVELPKGTIINNKDLKTKIDTSKIGISEAKKSDLQQAIIDIKSRQKPDSKNIDEKIISDNTKIFEFGIQDQPLVFSKPVKITLPADLRDGSSVEILVKHNGDTNFGVSGLTLNPNSICNSDGTITDQQQSILPIVDNGNVSFYTCAASSFTMNTGGGVSGSNDLKLIIGDCGQFQLSYDGLNNIYTGNPPATGCNTSLDSWMALRIGGTTYWSESNNWSTRTTSGGQNGNTYTGTTTMTRVVSGRTYTLLLNRKYIAPNKYFTIDYSVNIPTGNTNNVRFYIGNDSTVGGNDNDDVGYYNTTPTNTVGVYDNILNQVSAIRHLSGSLWTGYEAGPYTTIRNRISGGTDFNNTIQGTSGDLGFGVNWNYGTTPGTRTGSLEWRTSPYVAGSVPDLVPGIGIPTPDPMQVGVDATIPILVSNVGNASSSGVHTVVLSYSGALISGPLTPFVSNGWSCSAESGATVTCNKTTNIASLIDDTFNIIVRPKISASGLTTRFDVSLTNASDSDNTNNTAFSNILVAVQPPPSDTIAPNISSITPLSGSLSPVGINFTYNYSDTGSQIDQSSATGTLSKWNSSGSNWIVQTGSLTATSISSGSTTFSSNNISYGKYKLDVSIKDNQANTSTGSSIFYLDQPEIIIRTGTINIGNLLIGSNTFSSDEIIITAKTVGAPFNIIMNKLNPMVEFNLSELLDWDGLKGFGYDLFPYTSNIFKVNTNELISNQSGSINTNGNLNTYTYKIKMGALADFIQQTGNYQTNLSFGINLNY